MRTPQFFAIHVSKGEGDTNLQGSQTDKVCYTVHYCLGNFRSLSHVATEKYHLDKNEQNDHNNFGDLGI